MRRIGRAGATLVATLAAGAGVARAEPRDETCFVLTDGWSLQSSAQVGASGEQLSRAGFPVTGWHAARVPSTVLAALVADGTYPDPHFGLNLRRIPGTSYPIGENFSNLEPHAASPFVVPWWYRTEFSLPSSVEGRTLWLRFAGVNFRFDAWLNGTRIATADETAGAFRTHELDVTRIARRGANALAVLVQGPRPTDLAITFVDWNPMPPDRLMGLFRPVTLAVTGPVALRDPQVVTKLPTPALDRAELTVKVFAHNAAATAVRGVLRGRIGEVAFERAVALAPGERREIVLAPAELPQLVISKPRLWWPVQYGRPELYELRLGLVVAGRVSDRARLRFGIREIGAELTAEGHRLFRVNGRPILIRGAGWTSELLLRGAPERVEDEIRYVKDIGLNTIRLEGKLEDDHFFDVTDREGILVMPGWCCCDHWEKWERWDEQDFAIATASLRDQILRLRSRASVFTWLNGSDNPPPARVERAYLEVLRELGFPNPILSSATEKAAELTGPSGVKMMGPYDWVPPVYWYADTRLGGAHGFATEVGPGPAPPPLESLKRFLPAERLWPIEETWSYHCGGGPFKALDHFNTALDARYGPSSGVEEYARKAQVAAYESHRAMLESFGARKYRATGVIQWMLNNAWPSLIWHLYDFYLRPGGSYFGAKKACEPLHVQYAYDDRSVLVVNSTLERYRGLTAEGRLLDLDAGESFRRSATLEVAPDGVARAFTLPERTSASPTQFLFLSLSLPDGRVASRNVYWLSSREETLAWDKSEWYYTPVRQYADYSALSRLPAAPLRATAAFEEKGGEGRARVRLHNPSKAIAFFVRASVRRGGPDGDEVLPVLWDDDYVTLAPSETRELVARYASRNLAGLRPVVTVEGWNVAATTAEH